MALYGLTSYYTLVSINSLTRKKSLTTGSTIKEKNLLLEEDQSLVFKSYPNVLMLFMVFMCPKIYSIRVTSTEKMIVQIINRIS